MQIIENKSFDMERALYGSDGIKLINCTFEGEADGESALKESKNIEAYNSTFKLRYPFWHDQNVLVKNCSLLETARAPFWYSENITVDKTSLQAPKALRECNEISITDSDINSSEFGWSCQNIEFKGVKAHGEYFMLRAENITIKDVDFSGKYSFQYVKNATFENCTLNTKDAFWHAENVYVKNSIVNGEYLGWYSKKLTLENCIITGTQPLCYAQGLKLINCEMHLCDLAFEKSDVEASITTPVISIKNPSSGRITAPSVDEIIMSDKEAKCEIVLNKEEALV